MSANNLRSQHEAPWLFAQGEMAEEIRAFEWSSTGLGPIQHWPASLRSALDTMLGCAFPTTLQWGPDLLLFYNDAYVPLIGDRHLTALGQPILKSFPEIYGPMAKKVMGGERIVLEDQLYRYTRHDKPEDLWFNLSYSPVHDETDKVAGILAIGLNTTGRVLAEKAKANAEARLRRVLETDAVGIIFFDFTGTVVDANDVFLRMVGYTREDIAGRNLTWRTLTPDEWVPASEAQMENLVATGRIGPYEKEYILKDGTRRWMLFAGRDLGDGTIAEYCIDVTARKLAEDALVRSEKLATLGRLAATIAHEINNPLEAMTNLLYLIHTSEDLPEEAREHARAADAELKRVAHITRQSLGFYRESSGPAITSIAEVLDASIDLLNAKIVAKRAQIHKDWDGELSVHAVSGELRQLFSNLLANALDALPVGGQISIRARHQRCSASSGTNCIRITFADNGKGIAAELRTQIFDPFFSTKGNLGNGLGLWVTKQIVTKHGGNIHMLTSTVDGRSGTVFSVTLPEEGITENKSGL